MKQLVNLLFSICVLGAIAQADPRLWGNDGVAVRRGHYIEYYRTATQNESGQTLLCWTDMRTGSRDVYAQLLDESGNALWEPGGVAVVSGMRYQYLPTAVAVAGGWIIAWIDFRDDSLCGWGEDDLPCGDIYAQKLDNAGNRLWPDNDWTGVLVDAVNDGLAEPLPDIVHDGSGGAYIIWQAISTLDNDIFAQRMTSDGVIAWAEPLDLSGERSDIWSCQVDSDGTGNLLVAYKIRIEPFYEIVAAKFSPDGIPLWGAAGVSVLDSLEVVHELRACADGIGGCYLAWSHFGLDDWYANLSAQHLGANGQRLWTDNGISLCSAQYEQSRPRIVASYDGATSDGMLAVWEDRRADNFLGEIYGHKISPDGTLLWAENGVRICGDPTPPLSFDCRFPRLASDRTGGMLVVWEDSRNDEEQFVDVYAARLNASGANLWTANGVPVADEPESEETASIHLTETSAVVPYFRDGSTRLDGIRAQALDLQNGDRLLGDAGAAIVEGIRGNADAPQALSLGAGRTAIVWEDSRFPQPGPSVFYQIYSSDGVPQCESNGLQLALSAPDYWQGHPALCSDDAGGFFVAFEDFRGEIGLIRLSHVNADGEVIDSDSGEVVWQDAQTLDQSHPLLVPDGQGGCFVAWSGYTPAFWMDMWVMQMNAQLQRAWTEPVRLMVTPEDDQISSLVPSTAGSCIVSWIKGNADVGYDVAAARIEADANVAWHLVVCGAEADQDNAAMIPDGQGGAYVAWSDLRSDASLRDIYAQHITAAGTMTWTDNGLPVCAQPQQQIDPRIALGSDGNPCFVWEDYRDGFTLRLFAQKLSSAGQALWESNAVSIASHDICLLGGIVTDDHAGFYAAWVDWPGYMSKAFVTHVDSTGEVADDPFWHSDTGGVVSPADVGARTTIITTDGQGGCIVAWEGCPESYVSNFGVDLGIQRLNEGIVPTSNQRGSQVPLQYALHQNYPNPFNSVTTIAFDLPQAGNIELKVFDLLGREVAVLANRQLEAGHHTLPFDATPFASGIYFYRLHAGNFEQSRKLLLLK